MKSGKIRRNFYVNVTSLRSKSGKLFNSTLGNLTLKHFDSLLETKQKLLENQVIRTKNASISLFSHFQLEKLKNFHRMMKIKNELKSNQSALKIQKVFRGYLSRKNTYKEKFQQQKISAFGKISKIKEKIDSLFYNNEITEKAVKKIQKAFRSYKTRKLLEIWLQIYKKIKKIREIKVKLKAPLAVLSCKLKLQTCLEIQNRKKFVQKLKEAHSLKIIKNFWIRHKLTLEKFLRNIKRFKSKYTKFYDDKSRTLTQDSTSLRTSDEIPMTRRSSLKKKNQLPPLPMTPKTMKQKAMIFLLKPKKVLPRLPKPTQTSQHPGGLKALPKILI